MYIAGNNLTTIPAELRATINNDPSQADLILGYLRNLQKGTPYSPLPQFRYYNFYFLKITGSKRAYNIKLMFVGNGNVGKTTLLRGLMEEIPITWMQRLAGATQQNTPVTKGHLGPSIYLVVII